MKHDMKVRIHRLNQALNKPISIILVLLLLFAFFAAQNAQFQKDNRTIIEQTQISAENTNTIVGQLKKVLCEDIPASQCNLSKAVAELKEDNRVKNNIIICMLQVPQPQRVPVEENCRKQAETTSTSSAASSNKATSTPQGAAPSSSQGAASSPNSAPNNGNGQGNNDKPRVCSVPIFNGLVKAVDAITPGRVC